MPSLSPRLPLLCRLLATAGRPRDHLIGKERRQGSMTAVRAMLKEKEGEEEKEEEEEEEEEEAREEAETLLPTSLSLSAP
jgi:hypothetical protein